jgi:nucleotide-binding universal stress UspA family protein
VILIGYDGSDGAKAAIRGAGRLFPGQPALVVSAYPSVASAAGAASVGVPAAVLGEAAGRLDEASRQGAQERADEGAGLASEAGLSAEGRAEVTDGPAWSTLIRVGDEQDAAAVVVGSRGLTGLKEVLLGSTSSGLVHHATRPVVVVPDDG